MQQLRSLSEGRGLRFSRMIRGSETFQHRKYKHVDEMDLVTQPARAFQRVFSIYLQNLASILPRPSLIEFARSPRTVRIIIIIITITDPPGAISKLPRNRRDF